MDLDSAPSAHFTSPSPGAEPSSSSFLGDARRLVERHRAQRDVVALFHRPEGVVFCNVLPRSQDGSACSITCPVCEGSGHLKLARPRPVGAPQKTVEIECPLCLSVGVAEPGYADFAACYQDADLHDVRSFADQDGRRIVIKPRDSDALLTLSQAHTYLMRQS